MLPGSTLPVNPEDEEVSHSRAIVQGTKGVPDSIHEDEDALQNALMSRNQETDHPWEIVRKKLVLGRKNVKKVLESGDVGMFLDIVNVSLSLLACALYVIGVDVMLDRAGLKGITLTEQVVTIWFCLDYSMRMLIADNAVEYFWENQIDLISILPGIVDFLPRSVLSSGGSVLAILGIARVLKVLRLLRLQRLIAHFGDDEVMKQAFFMVNIFVFVIFFGAGLYHFCENLEEAVESRYNGNEISCEDAFNDPALQKQNQQLSKLIRDSCPNGPTTDPMYWNDWSQELRQLGEPDSVRWARRTGSWFDFGTAAYFVVVTMTTVGFGDFNPSTGTSRTLTSFLIIFTVVLVPMQTNELLSRINEQSVYNKRKYTVKKGHIHVVVAGAVNSNGLLHFVNEFFNADQLTEEIEEIVDMVILAPSAPSQDVLDLIEHPKFIGQIFYIAGSVLSPQDLKRVSFSDAKAIWLLSDKFSLTPSQSDNLTVIRSLSLRRFLTDARTVNPTVELPQVFTQLIQPSNREKVEPRDETKEDVLGAVLCLDEIKSVIMAKSCNTPGIFTLLNNLVTSASAPDTKNALAPWELEYQQGRDYEIYRVKLANTFNGQKFSRIAEVAFKSYSLLLIAVEHELKANSDNSPSIEPDGNIHVAPDNLIINTKLNAWAYVITEDAAQAAQLGASGAAAQMNTKVTSPNKLSRATSLRTLGDAVLYSESEGTLTSESTSASRIASIAERRSFRVDTTGSNGTLDSGEPPSPTTPGLRSTKDSIKLLTEDTIRESYVYEDKRPLREGIIQSVDDLLPENVGWEQIPRKRRHTVVCAYTSDLLHFVAPLRSRISTDEMVPVVVIVRAEYAAKVWENISIFHDVYVIIGSPSNAEDLIRAGVLYAKNLIVFANTEESANVNLHGERNTPESTKALDEIAAMADSDTIFINSSVTVMNPTIQIVSELVHLGNIPYLNDSHQAANLERPRKEVVVWPLIAAGNVYVASLNDYLSAQLFHNPSLVSLLEKILIGDRRAHTDGDLTETSLELISPYEMHAKDKAALTAGSSWETVFHLIIKEYNAIPIALYRGITQYGEEGTEKDFQNTMPYVVTNPPKNSVVRKQDKVFILSNDRTAAKLKNNMRANSSPSSSANGSKGFRLGGSGMPRRRLSKTVVEDMSLQVCASTCTRSRALL